MLIFILKREKIKLNIFLIDKKIAFPAAILLLHNNIGDGKLGMVF
jgi:hypothetical protein